MLNPNIEMLENLISAAVSTRYKEVPPTEEEFLTLAQSMRATLSTLPVTDEEFAEILVRLRASIVIQMDVGVYINDRNTPHKSWLPSRRADLDFFFWNRYKKYLEEIKHWNPRVTATLDKVSDEIVDLLGDPQSKEPFQRRGLVLGDVQSGKTANYTAISNKAADTGYRIIIVLAGMMENLRQQTQSRLDAEFSGRKSEYYLDPKAEQGIKNQPVGVGRYGVQKRIAAFTSVTKDFDINVLKSNDLNLQSVSDPIVLVVKKNKRILNNLIKWLSNSRDNTTGKIMLPMLLIDDEADNASVNTKSEDDSPAAINACIRQLLHEFNQASYLGITATPFANIFINPETEDEMIGDDLFPRDFIYSLAPPTNYIGADKIFGDATEKFSDVLIPLRREEMDLFFPFTHKKTLEVDALPPSMYEAIAYFLLFNAIRDLRGDYTEHRSMMIHVSRFTDVQNRIAEAVNEWLVQVKSDVQNYAALDDEKREQIASLRYLHKVWMKHQLEKISKTNWDDICSNYLNRAIAPIAVRAVNQRTGATSLDYFNHKEDGLRVIAVGGNSLSRGLTLEGLGVSYFYRKSQMYDTLLQMGRWFGYRPNYEDLFRIWMAEEAIDWYGYITRAANELKDEIAKMKLANQTPMEFGLKVRQDPNSLIATARNKMRSATQVSRPVTVSGKLLETPKLKAKAFVMENVSMLKSDVHRFYMEESDVETVKKYKIPVKSTQLHLLDQAYVFDGALEIVKDQQKIQQYLWPEQHYFELNVIYKAAKNLEKMKSALEKHKKKLCAAAADYAKLHDSNHIASVSAEAFQAISEYYSGELDASALKSRIEPAILIQRMLSKAQEIHENHIVVDAYSVEDGIAAVIRSFAVYDYLERVLQAPENDYVLDKDVLCAADYGAPQKRMRFVVIGIKRRISSKIALPKGRFDADEYRTVRDAISDLEDVKPVVELEDDKEGIALQPKENLGELASSLRDSKILKNHMVTKTTDTAMQRFKALKQGENYHALDDSLKTNTYTDASRTQNTIYLRLNYDEPCGTVVNVRKSMWIHPTRDRAISVREAARLQTFPDSFVFCGSKDKQYQQVGNAVPPIMAKSIAKKLAKVLKDNLPEGEQNGG